MSEKLPGEKVEPYEKRLKKTETLRIYDEGGIIVVKPLSYEASCLYGRKTKWCTSAVTSARNWSSHLAQNICFYIIINNNLPLDHVLYKVLAEVESCGEIRWWDAENTQIDKPYFIPKSLNEVVTHPTVIAPVCYTALFGNYEELKEPLVITPGWRYVCYTDQPIKSDVWEIIQTNVIDTPQRTARWFKIMGWVDWAKSIWVDASFVINTDLNDWYINYHLASFSAAKHPLRDDWFEECMDCIVSGRGDRVEVDKQMNEYKALYLPRHKGLITSGILLRENTDEVIKLCELWWQELVTRSVRDQIAFYRVSLGCTFLHTYVWDYRVATEFIYKFHYHRR